jgi:hypothetical protein
MKNGAGDHISRAIFLAITTPALLIAMQVAYVMTMFETIMTQLHTLAMHVVTNLAHTPVVMRTLRAMQLIVHALQAVTVTPDVAIVMTHFHTFVSCHRRRTDRLCGGKAGQGDESDGCYAANDVHDASPEI